MRFIIGCDFYPSYQQIAMLDTHSGELMEKSLGHENKEEVRAFSAGLPGPARVGVEASGQSQWFETHCCCSGGRGGRGAGISGRRLRREGACAERRGNGREATR